MGGEASGLETTRPSIFQFQLRSKMSHLVPAALAQNLVNRRNKVADQRLVIGIRFSGLAPDPAEAAQVLPHQVGIVAGFRRHH